MRAAVVSSALTVCSVPCVCVCVLYMYEGKKKENDWVLSCHPLPEKGSATRAQGVRGVLLLLLWVVDPERLSIRERASTPRDPKNKKHGRELV